MPSYSSPEIRLRARVKPTDGVPEPRSNRMAGFASRLPDGVRRPETSSVICISTVTVPPALVMRAGVTEVDTSTGALVSGAGITDPDGTDGADDPMEVSAVTVNVYETPLDSPMTLHDLAVPTAVHDCPPEDV